MQTTITVGPRKPQTQLPHHILTELLGQFSFSRNMERDVEIAENIATNTFSDVEDALTTIRGHGAKITQKQLKEIKENPYFKPYLRENINS